MTGIIELPYHYFGSRVLNLDDPMMHGTDIKVLQHLLNMLPGNIIPEKLITDGIYDTKTRNAVNAFKKHFNLKINGQVDYPTYYALGHRAGKYALNQPVFSSRALAPGAQGDDVLVLQQRMSSLAKTCLCHTPNSHYTPETAQAVQRFQEDFNHLTPNGFAGPGMFEELIIQSPMGGRTLAQGLHGYDIYWLQYYLYQLGFYNHPLTGYFDSKTVEAVKDFQRAAEIPSDGVVGPETFLALGTTMAYPAIGYTYRVNNDDSLIKVAALFAKKPEDIASFNNISPASKLTAGSLIAIPAPLTFHRAHKGMTITDLSALYGINQDRLHAANWHLPGKYLQPDQLVVLPGYLEDFRGDIVYLNQTPSGQELKTINLMNCTVKICDLIKDVDENRLFLNKDQNIASFFVNNGDSLVSYDFKCGKKEWIKLPYSARGTELDWAHNGNKIVVDDGLIIDPKSGNLLLSFKGSKYRWLKDGETLMFYENNTTLKQRNIVTGEENELFSLFQDSLWFYNVSPDDSKLVIIAFMPPGHVTVTYVYDLNTKELKEIGMNDFAEQWFNKSNRLLLQKRELFGDYKCFYYNRINLVDPDGAQQSQELVAKGVELGVNSIAIDDLSFIFIMFNPNAFYPIKPRMRDLYIKKVGSHLVTQLTWGEMVYSPAYHR
ncbi:MAG: LysM peptidoglycan-binding domain-containing protein [Syntrophomonadaceae bacterium]|nr:LysM peptidoglycan-binding domain-containing protein [Syntrophomonadaceae bacterium]